MATKAALEGFAIEELCDFLSSSGKLSEDTIEKFRYNRINGSTFFELNEADLKELLPIVGDRKVVQRIIASYQPSLTVSEFYFSAICVMFMNVFYISCIAMYNLETTLSLGS